MGLYKFLLDRAAWPVGERLSGLPIRKHLETLFESERWGRKQLEEHQNEAFRMVVKHAAENVPLYGKLYAEHGIRPNQIQSIADGAALPCVTKEILRAAGDEAIARGYKKDDLVVRSSSGSTGAPFRFYLSKEEKALHWAGLIRNWRWAGYEFGDRITQCTMGSLRTVLRHPSLEWIELAVLRQQWVAVYDLNQREIRQKLEEIRRFHPKVMRGYPSSLYYVARAAEGIENKLHIPCVISTGETLSDHFRETIVSAFGSDVFDQYGAEGMIVASECEMHDGMHVNDEHVLLEILDENTLQPAKRGEIVLTNLWGLSMPFIRYRVMDLGERQDGECRCGRAHSRLRKLEGRMVDCFLLSNGRYLSPPPFCDFFCSVPDVVTFQVRQLAPDRLSILVQCVDGVLSDESRTRIRKEAASYIGEGVSFEVEVVESIPTTKAGKRRFFLSEMGEPADR